MIWLLERKSNKNESLQKPFFQKCTIYSFQFLTLDNIIARSAWALILPKIKPPLCQETQNHPQEDAA